MKDIYNDAVIVPLVEAADLAHTDTQSKYVDLAGFEACEVVVAIGALTGVDASNYLTPTLQEASATPGTAGNYAAVDSANVIGGFSKVDATTKDSVVQRACYVGSKRYVNVKLGYTGTLITAGIVGVYAILRRARKGPESALTPTTGAVA